MLNNGKKKLILRFLLSPSKFLLTDDEKSVKALEFLPQNLVGEVNEQRAVNNDTLDPVRIESDVVIKSIGYASTPLAGVPFNPRTQTIPHEFGCVLKSHEEKEAIPGLYVCGWAKRGPIGIIDATLRDTKETFGVLRHHIETDQLPEMHTTVEDIEKLLLPRHVTYEQWMNIDKIEKQRGEQILPGKVREKVLDRDEMLRLAKMSDAE